MKIRHVLIGPVLPAGDRLKAGAGETAFSWEFGMDKLRLSGTFRKAAIRKTVCRMRFSRERKNAFSSSFSEKTVV